MNKNNKNHNLTIKQFQDFNIRVYGTYERPLFKAKDIGNLFGIENITDYVYKLDEKYKVENDKEFKYTTILTCGSDNDGYHEYLFLTEYGLYELLFILRKPLVKHFKIWLRNIRVKEKFLNCEETGCQCNRLERELLFKYII